MRRRGITDKTRAHDAAIVAALREAKRPLTAYELTERLLGGPPPHREWNRTQGRLMSACRRGVIARSGRTPHGSDGYRYSLPKVGANC